jgi:hypothetical protein
VERKRRLTTVPVETCWVGPPLQTANFQCMKNILMIVGNRQDDGDMTLFKCAFTGRKTMKDYRESNRPTLCTTMALVPTFQLPTV